MRPALLIAAVSLTLYLSLLLTACGTPFWLPPAHKIVIQQGNLLSQAQVDELTVGMTRDEVLRVAGQPVLEGAWHSDRWDYVYTKGPAGKAIKARSLSVIFTEDRVVELSDNHATETGEIVEPRNWWQRLFNRT